MTSSPHSPSKSPSRSLEEQFAPHTDKQWVSDFILEARLLEVPGATIGDSLAEIDSHVVESGESAQEAFGGPADYARSVSSSFGTSAPTTTSDWYKLLGPTIALLAGFVIALRGIGGIVQGYDQPLTWLIVGVLTALFIAIPLVGRIASVLVTGALRKPIITILVVSVVSGLLFMGFAYLFTAVVPLVPLSAPQVLILGLVVMVAGSAWHVYKTQRHPHEDPLVDPSDKKQQSTSKTVLPATPLLFWGALIVTGAIIWFVS